jgi:hypothetical protein
MSDELSHFVYEGQPARIALVNVGGFRPTWVDDEALVLAHENGVDLAGLAGSGDVSASDVQGALDERENPSVNATSGAIAYAEEQGIDLATVEGTGADGRIGKDDVKAAVAAQPEPDPTDPNDPNAGEGA